MVQQKAISVKLNYDILDILDEEARLGYRKRNTLINDAVRAYIALQDCQRRVRSVEDVKSKKEFAEMWLRRYFPEIANW